MSTADDIIALGAMPYGQARTAAAESIVRRLEAEGSHEHLPWALLSLVEAYTFDSAGDRAFVPFARLLRLWDESPELFDEQDRELLFWEYKWIADGICEYPQISREQAVEFLADMERRYRLEGLGLSAVAVSRFNWARYSDAPDAEELRLAWRALPSDEFDDCPACIIGTQVDYFLERGEFEEALRLGATQSTSCNIEPVKTHHAMALAALELGDAELALRCHRLAVSAGEEQNRNLGPARGRHFELLARGGALDRALRALRNEDAALLRGRTSPLEHLLFLRGVLAGLSAEVRDRGELDTGIPVPGGGGSETVASLHRRLLEEASGIAERFDARNGNGRYRELLEEALRSERTAVELDFSVAAEQARRLADPSEHQEPTAVSPASTPLDPYSRAEALAERGEHAAASIEYAAAARLFESEGLLERSGLSYAEAAQCAAIADDEDAAHSSFEHALARLIAGGAADSTLVQVLAAWAPLAVRVADTAGILDHLADLLARLEEPFDGAGLGDELAQRLRNEHDCALSNIRDLLARTLASTPSAEWPERLRGSSPAAEATLAAECFARLGRLSDAAHAFWLAARVQRDEGDTAAAVYSFESAFEGFELSHEQGLRAEVAGELIELLRSAGMPERADEVTAKLQQRSAD